MNDFLSIIGIIVLLAFILFLVEPEALGIAAGEVMAGYQSITQTK